MVILALRGCVELHLKMVKLGVQDTINWKAIENEVASMFGVKQDHVFELRQKCIITGEVIVRERVAAEVTEEAVEEVAVTNRSKIWPHNLLALCQWVDRQHSQ